MPKGVKTKRETFYQVETNTHLHNLEMKNSKVTIMITTKVTTTATVMTRTTTSTAIMTMRTMSTTIVFVTSVDYRLWRGIRTPCKRPLARNGSGIKRSPIVIIITVSAVNLKSKSKKKTEMHAPLLHT